MDTSQNDPNDTNAINNELSNQQPNLLVPQILPNQNIPFLAASAADLPLPQDINDALSIQQQNLLLPSNSNAGNVLGLVPQASQLINQIHSTNNPNDMDTF